MSLFTHGNDILKVDDELGLVLGWAIVCKVDGEDYFDTQGHHIPESVMLEAALDFMQKSGTAGEMHFVDEKGEKVDAGTVPFLFPITTEVKEAFDLQVNKTGLLIGSKPTPEVLQKVRSGQYRGFSIGGKCTDWET